MVSAEMIRARQEAAHDEWRPGGLPINVGQAERLACNIGGGVLVAVGLLRGGLRGLVTAGLGGALLYRGATGHCSLYHAIGASTADAHGPSDSVPAQAGVRVEEAVTINRPAEELFRFWRDYANVPRFMSEVESVTVLGGNRAHWVIKGPFGSRLEYDAETHNEDPGRMIAWRSLEGGDLDVAGSVHFTPAPGGRGTEVRLNQKINPPLGKVGVAVAKLLGHDPRTQAREDLRRLKQLMEVGEIVTNEGQPSGRA
jgi:uncharacterized membrane protein